MKHKHISNIVKKIFTKKFQITKKRRKIILIICCRLINKLFLFFKCSCDIFIFRMCNVIQGKIMLTMNVIYVNANSILVQIIQIIKLNMTANQFLNAISVQKYFIFLIAYNSLVFQINSFQVFDSREKILEHDKNHRSPCPYCGKMILKSSMKLHLIKHTDKHM